MNPSHPRIIFPEEIRAKLRSYIKSRAGLYFSGYDLKGLDNAIIQRMKALSFDAVLTYYNYLMASDAREDELRELLNLLTINHTYFFRSAAQFKVLKEKILPELLERKSRLPISDIAKKPSIRIWSAGCSTGEEPYSIALILKEAIPDIENWDIRILATDVSTEALTAARKGSYSQNAVRLVDAAMIDRYFTRTRGPGKGERYEISDEIKKMVSIGFFNLMDEDFPAGIDIIFCRNVTIYFDPETTARVIDKFEHSLDDEGCLFIGYSETLQRISNKFKMIFWLDAIYYEKTKDARYAPPHGRAEPIGYKQMPVVEAGEPAAEVEQKLPGKDAKKKRSQKAQELIDQAEVAMYAKDFKDALSLISRAKAMDTDDVEIYYINAEIHARQGKFDDAKESLDKALKIDAMFAPAYYLYGLLYTEAGLVDEAERSFKKTLYLEKDFPMAHLGLANIHKERGLTANALREYRNTLSDLSKSGPYDIIAHSGGFNASTLSGVCKDNIERLKVAVQ